MPCTANRRHSSEAPRWNATGYEKNIHNLFWRRGLNIREALLAIGCNASDMHGFHVTVRILATVRILHVCGDDARTGPEGNRPLIDPARRVPAIGEIFVLCDAGGPGHRLRMAG